MKDKIKENVPLLLTVLSAFMAAIILVEFVQFGADTAKANSFVKTAIKDVNNTDKQIAETIKTLKEPADNLKKHSIFFPPPKAEQCPVKTVNGIFGDEAIINGKMYKVGAKVGSAEIIKIEAAEVTILWNGKEQKFAPIAAAVKDDNVVVKKEPKNQKKEDKKQIVKKTTPQVEEFVQDADEQEEDVLAWLGVDLTEDQREKLEYFFANVPEEFAQGIKAQFSNMSDEEKQEALIGIDEMSMDELVREVNEMKSQMETEGYKVR